MKTKVCLDTGIVTLYYLEDTPKEIQALMGAIIKGDFIAYMPNDLLIETYYHLCVGKGTEFADACLRSFHVKTSVELISLTDALIARAGALKCQYRKELSYHDCIVIALSLQEKALLCTTEKELPKIKNLSVKKYRFD